MVKEIFNSLSKTAKVVFINIGIIALLAVIVFFIILRIKKKGQKETEGILGVINKKVEEMTNTKVDVIKKHEDRAAEIAKEREEAVEDIKKDKENNFEGTIQDKNL